MIFLERISFHNMKLIEQVAEWLIFNKTYFENLLGQIPFFDLIIILTTIEGLPIVSYDFRSNPH